jgi:hypothetical protein
MREGKANGLQAGEEGEWRDYGLNTVCMVSNNIGDFGILGLELRLWLLIPHSSAKH